MRRAAATAVSTSVLFGSLATVSAAQAGPVTRGVYVEEFDGTEQFAPGENQCVAYAGTLHEVRSGQFILTTLGNGPRSAELKVRGAVDGSIEITPTYPADGPSYQARTPSVWWGGSPTRTTTRSASGTTVCAVASRAATARRVSSTRPSR